MGKTKVPRLSKDDIYKEISLRSSLPAYMVETVIRNYTDIIFQCLENEVAIPLSGVGVFIPITEPPREYSESLCMLNGQPVVFYRKKADGYIRFKFRPFRRFTRRLANTTLIPYGSMPTDRDRLVFNRDDVERIDYIAYMREHHPERTEFQDNENDVDVEEEQEQDEYDMLLNDVEEGI